MWAGYDIVVSELNTVVGGFRSSCVGVLVCIEFEVCAVFLMCVITSI